MACAGTMGLESGKIPAHTHSLAGGFAIKSGNAGLRFLAQVSCPDATCYFISVDTLVTPGSRTESCAGGGLTFRFFLLSKSSSICLASCSSFSSTSSTTLAAAFYRLQKQPGFYTTFFSSPGLDRFFREH
jgi:hypothetical protein